MSTLSESASTALQLTLSYDPVLWTIVGRSLSVSATACLVACGVGLVLGAWLGVARFAGRGCAFAHVSFDGRHIAGRAGSRLGDLLN